VRFSDSTFTGNSAQENGGGISLQGDIIPTPGGAATIIVEDSQITANTAGLEGGGIDNRGDETIELTGNTISNNVARDGGGVTHVGDGELHIDATRLKANVVSERSVNGQQVGGNGGGILMLGDGALSVSRSVLDDNIAEYGAGMSVDGDSETHVVNTTFYENEAGTNGGGILSGADGAVTVDSSTFSRNLARSGASIRNKGASASDGPVTLRNTILAFARAPEGATAEECMGAVFSAGGNIDRRDSCNLRGTGDLTLRDPKLLSLAQNGGPTPTVALKSDSPAIDSALSEGCPATDQRGTARPLGAGCDMGAYESAASNPCVMPDKVVQADADAWIEQSSPSANKGTDGILKVRSQTAGNNFRALVRFSLPALPAGCQLRAAKLRLYAASATGGRTLEALAVAAAWDEGAVTWASQPATAGTPATAASAAGWVEWPVTEAVAAMYGGANHGFLIKDAAEDGSGEVQQFNSREKAPDPTPQLVITIGP
jgi:predicted outer membrane repeat protein